jgi:hypothetical protein
MVVCDVNRKGFASLPVQCAMKYILTILTIFFIENLLAAQTRTDTLSVRLELERIFDRDQKTRATGDSVAFMGLIDSTNQVRVKAIIQKYGWPGISFVGKKANQAVFLVIQHSPLVVMMEFIEPFRKSVAAGESRAVDLALMEDRIRMRMGKPQIYGSQVRTNKISGLDEFYPIEDEIHVNERRKKIGLEPLEEYAKRFGMTYELPKK